MPDCDHSGLEEYGKQERLELLLKGETVDCPGCGMTFKPQRDHYQGDIYLVSTDVENPQVEGPR